MAHGCWVHERPLLTRGGGKLVIPRHVTRIIRCKGLPIRDIVYLSEKLRDMTLYKLVCLDEIRDSWEHYKAASEMQGHLYSYFTRTPGPVVSLRVVLKL